MSRPNVIDIYSQLKLDEGTGPMRSGQHMPYVDTTGNITIGYGRNLSVAGISGVEAEALLATDVRWMKLHLPVWSSRLDPARQGVLINIAFNVGGAELYAFVKFLALMQASKFQEASVELLDSVAAKQAPERYARLARQVETGEWQ